MNYAYFTVNSARGEIVVLKDNGTNVSYETLYTPSHSQYCTMSLVADSSGTLYYANDSGYLSAIINTNEANTNKAKVAFEVTPVSQFDSSTYTTTYPTISVKNNSGVEVTTSALGTYYLGAGTYTYAVSLSGYTTGSGSLTISASDIVAGSKTVPVSLSKPSSGGTTSNMTASVSVLGYKGSSVLGSRTLSLTSGESAWNVIKKVLDDAGINYVAKSTGLGVYISSVNGLAEFDKGPNSGWEYTVNGTKPSVGVSQYILSSNDNVVLYYIADYTTERGSAASTSTSVPIITNLTETINSLAGVSSVTLNGDALSTFTKNLSTQSDEVGAKVTIKISTPTGAAGMNLTIPQTAISTLSNKINTALYLETGVGNLTFDPIAIDSISASAGGNDITFAVTKLDSSTLNEENRALVGNHPVYDLSVMAAGAKITKFGEGLVHVNIPYTPNAGEDTSKLTVYYIDSEGKATEMSGVSYDSTSGCMTFATSHFSTFAVVDCTLKKLKK